MLAAVLLAACAGRSGPPAEDTRQSAIASLRAATGNAIKDPARAKSAAAIVDRIQQQYAETVRVTQTHALRMRELDADYDATLPDFRQALADYAGGREERRARLLELREQLVAATSAEEWQRLDDFARDALAPLLAGASPTPPLTEWLDKGRGYIKDQVANPVPRSAALDAMDEIEDRQDDLRKAEERAARTIGRLAEDRKARAGDFQPAFATLRAETRDLQEKMLLARFRAKSLVTREQWAAAHRFQGERAQ